VPGSSVHCSKSNHCSKMNRLTTYHSRVGHVLDNCCFNSGKNFFAGHKQVSPAQRKSYRSCGKLNHFAKVCRSLPKRMLEFGPRYRQKPSEIGNSIKAIITTLRETGSSSDDEGDECSFTLSHCQS
jgi:hypothetical protein